MATTTNDVLNVLYNQLEGQQNLLSSLQNMYGNELGEYLYNTFVAKVAEWAQVYGDVTYNPYTGVVYIGANFTGLSEENKDIVDVGTLCEDAKDRCHETWLDVFNAVYTAISALDEQAMPAYTTEQLALLFDVKTAIADSWGEWTKNWFTTVDATGYDANVNAIGELTFVPADGVTIKANAGGSIIKQAGAFESAYTVYGGTGSDTFFYEKSVDNGHTSTVTLINWSADDVLHLEDVSINGLAQVQDGDVSLTLGNGNGSNTLVLKDMAGKAVKVFRKYSDRSYDVVYGSEAKGSYAVVGEGEQTFILPSTNDNWRLGVPNIDATGNSQTGLQITGNTLDNEIWAGSGGNFIDAKEGNDTVHGGAGSDTYYLGREGDYTDVVEGWEDNDVIQIDGGQVSSFSADTVNGGDVTITFKHNNSGDQGQVLQLKGKAGQVIHLTPTNSPKTNDVSKTYDIIFGGSNEKGSRVLVGADEQEFSLPSVDYAWRLGVPNIDATGNSKAGLALMGNEQDNEIWAGSGGNFIDAKEGNDTVHGGAGSDTYYPYEVPDEDAE